jgi:hypothetical protein
MAAGTRLTRQQLDEMATLGLAQAAYQYVCPKCQDAGYLNLYPIGGGPDAPFGYFAWQLAGTPSDKIFWCDCGTGKARRIAYGQGFQEYEQARIDAAFDAAGIPPRFMDLTFDTLAEQWRTGKELAIAAARMFLDRGHVRPCDVSEYDPTQSAPARQMREGLAFIGKPGVGKTGILSVAFRGRMEKGAAGLWVELYDFFETIQSCYGTNDGSADKHLDAARKAPLLFLDDVGDPDRRQSNGAIREETDDKRRLLWEIMDYRHANGLPTLVTSNLSRSDFERQWGTRLAARLWELCWVVTVGGIDLREV